MKRKLPVLTIALAFLCIGLVAYIAYNELYAPDGDGKNCTDCTKKTFCGIPPDMAIRLIRNYKNEVWSRTSNETTQQYDARFMELPVGQLENFICYAKRSAAADGLNLASIRIYYINYDGAKKTETYLQANHTGNVLDDYSGCHSLAFVPVVGKDMTDPVRRDYYMSGMNVTGPASPEDFKGDGQNDKEQIRNLVFIPGLEDRCSGSSPIANHNELCPPFVGCITNTLLAIADAP